MKALIFRTPWLHSAKCRAEENKCPQNSLRTSLVVWQLTSGQSPPSNWSHCSVDQVSKKQWEPRSLSAVKCSAKNWYLSTDWQQSLNFPDQTVSTTFNSLKGNQRGDTIKYTAPPAHPSIPLSSPESKSHGCVPKFPPSSGDISAACLHFSYNISRMSELQELWNV